MLALPIFAASRPATIVGEGELNFCVRYGNRWTLTPINTNNIIVARLQHLDYTTFFQKVKKKVVTRTGFEPMLMA